MVTRTTNSTSTEQPLHDATSVTTSSLISSNATTRSKFLGMNLQQECVGAFNMTYTFSTACKIQNVFDLTRLRIAIIEPVFTTTAYSSFYRFYATYPNLANNTNVTQNTDLLNASIVYDWGASASLHYFVTSPLAKQAGMVIGKNAFIFTDINVNDGALFNSTTGQRSFDVAILGFSEYVTQAEYSYYRQFVQTGGRLIVLSGCSFLARVTYDANASKLILDEGHGYEFNGTVAHGGVYDYFYKNNTNWVGSNYGPLFYANGYTFRGALANTDNPISTFMRTAAGTPNILLSYQAHEENAMTNSSDNVIAYWPLTAFKSTDVSYISHKVVATYEHDYGKGIVVHMGIFGTDLITDDVQFQLLLLASIGMPAFTS